MIRLIFFSLFLSQANAQTTCSLQKNYITEIGTEVHGSTIVETADGKLMSAWFSGGEGNVNATIQTSTWNGSQWSKPVVVETGVENGKDYPVWNPVLFTNDQGLLELDYKVGPKPHSWWGRKKTSPDHGQTWSAFSDISTDPRSFGPIRAKPIKLKNGNWIAGSSRELLLPPPATGEVWTLHLEAREKNGGDWRYQNVFEKDSGNKGLIQPIVLEFPNGKLQLLARSNRKKIVESWSADQGKTWSPLADTKIKNPNSGFDGIVHQITGNALLVYNDSTSGRGNLKIAKSTDGKTWTNICTLENGLFFLEYSYPAMIQDSKGQVHVTYTDNRRSIRHAILNLK